MLSSFNADGRHNGIYTPVLNTFIITADTILMLLSTDGFSEAQVASMAANLAHHEPLDLQILNDDLQTANLAAAVDTSRPGQVVAPGQVQLYLRSRPAAPEFSATTLINNPAQQSLPGLPISIQLPDTTAEVYQTAQALRQQFPLLPVAAARTFITKAARLLSALGCRSEAELTARATSLRADLELPLSRAEATKALLCITFSRFPTGGSDRQQMLTVLIAASGGPIGTTAGAAFTTNGPFGRCAENPVPVAGIVSNALYLERLRTPAGWPLLWQRTGSVSSNGGPVDRYVVEDLTGQPQGEVFISPYHQHTTTQPPQGLELSPEE